MKYISPTGVETREACFCFQLVTFLGKRRQAVKPDWRKILGAPFNERKTGRLRRNRSSRTPERICRSRRMRRLHARLLDRDGL